MAKNVDTAEAAIGSQFGIKILDAETECERNSAAATADARAALARGEPTGTDVQVARHRKTDLGLMRQDPPFGYRKFNV